jgi:LysM domain
VLLATTALSIALALGTPVQATPTTSTPPLPRVSHLPATQPGRGATEGVFLLTTTDDGSSVDYFVAGGERHSILPADMQLELTLNPLWPVHTVSADDALALPEGAPIGDARTGLLAVSPEVDTESDVDAGPAEAVDSGEAVEANSEKVDAVEAVGPDFDSVEAVEPASESAPTYTVVRGDSAFLIARRFGVDQSALLAANGISNPNRVYVGQVLTIPNG